MKRAARAALDVCIAQWSFPEQITVFCGAGNNGGDGYLLAALAAEQQIPVCVYSLVSEGHLTNDVLRAKQYACDAGVACVPWKANMQLPKAGVIVDALIGTGIRGAPRGIFAEAIIVINQSALPVLAMDVPSGLNANTGIAEGDVVGAAVTVTFMTRKRGLFTGQSADLCGVIEYAGLGVDDALMDAIDSDCEMLILDDLVKQYLQPRSRTAHKGHFGHVMVIGGDSGMGGAVLLAAESAARTGCGLTSAATRPEHVMALLARRPEIMASGVTSGQGLEPLLKRPSVLVVGPGLGRSAWSEQMLQQATLCGLPLVLDADALTLLAEGRVVRDAQRDNWILTPHPAEAARLLSVSTDVIQRNRFAAAEEIQKTYGGVVVLKGPGTLVCGIDGRIGVCTHGNPGMASGGMGDVLAGIIGSLIAQGIDLEAAARTGVCLHGVAADRAAELQGERGLLASDVIAQISSLVNPRAQ